MKDEFGGNFGPGGFAFVAVGDDAAEKIRGAAGDAGEAFGEQAAGAAFRGGDRGAIGGEKFGDDVFEGDGFVGEDAVAQRQFEAADDFVERCIGLGGVFGPEAEVNLDFAGGGEDCGVHVRIAGVDRADAFFDVRFAEAGDAKFAVKHADAGNAAAKARQDLFEKERFEFARRAGKQRDHAAFVFNPQAGSGAAGIFEDFRAFRHHGLAGFTAGMSRLKLRNRP